MQGPTEVNRYSQEDMGLTDEDIVHLTEVCSSVFALPRPFVVWIFTNARVVLDDSRHGKSRWALPNAT